MTLRYKELKYRVKWIREDSPEQWSATDKETAERVATILRKSPKNSEVEVVEESK